MRGEAEKVEVNEMRGKGIGREYREGEVERRVGERN